MTTFRERGRSGAGLVGTFVAIPHPVAVEVSGRAGLDFLCIDWEHAQISRGRIEDLIRAADVGGTPAMVRVPGHGSEAIAAVLDAGAAGVLVPRVSTAAQAEAAVSAMRYPPDGARGAGPGRAARFGPGIVDHIATANGALLLAVQVETVEGLANAAEIAAVDGVDVVFIGPGDLAVSLGAFGPGGEAKLEEAIGQIIAACKAAGRAVGLFRPSAADVARWRAAGVSFFIIGSDATLLGTAMGAVAAAARAPAASAPAKKGRKPS